MEEREKISIPQRVSNPWLVTCPTRVVAALGPKLGRPWPLMTQGLSHSTKVSGGPPAQARFGKGRPQSSTLFVADTPCVRRKSVLWLFSQTAIHKKVIVVCICYWKTPQCHSRTERPG